MVGSLVQNQQKILNKIISIQWCRAIAIIAVTAFHIWPELFPNGYLGVDIFFVISGYLIAMIMVKLLKEYSFTEAMKIFYIRRFKRIFPVYYLTILCVICLGFVLLHHADFDYLRNDSRWAVFFATNIKTILDERNYFKMASDYKPLLHTWSLAIEIQFYMIAPMLFFVFQKLATQRFNPKFCLTLLLIGSFLLYFYYMSTTISFNFMFCRLWQFAVGILVYYRHCENKQNGSKIYKILVSASIICFLFLPYKFNDHVSRILITIGCSDLLVMNPVLPHELMSQLLCYIGDISYSVYLVHWPVVIFFRHAFFTHGSYLMVFIIVILSIIQYHLIEQQLRKFSFKFNGIITFVFAVFAISLSFLPSKQKPMEFSIHENVTTIEDSLRYNDYLHSACSNHSIKCRRDKYLKSYFRGIVDTKWAANCVIESINNNHQVAVLTGNSFISAHAKAIVQAINESRHGWKFKKIYILSQEGCPIFDSLNEPEIEREFSCTLSHGLLKKVINDLKPDLIITMNRQDQLSHSKVPMNEEKNNLTNRLTTELEHFASLTKNLIVLEPNFVVEPVGDFRASALKIYHKLAKNESLDDLFLEKKRAEQQTKISWERMKKAAETCSNCHILEFRDLFCDQNECNYYDKEKNIAYFCDPWHLNLYGTRKIIPFLTELLNKLLI